jgi:hypothetical protein
MKKPASYSGFEQVAAGAAMLPKLYDPAALCILHAGEHVPGDLRAALIISLCPVFNDGVW